MDDGTRDAATSRARAIRWNPRGLHTRIVLVVVLAMLGPAAIFGWAAWAGLTTVHAERVADRARLGRSIADHFEYVVKSDLEVLQAIGVPGPHRVEPAPGNRTEEHDAVRDAYLRSRLLEAVVLVDRTGIVWEEPVRAREIDAGLAGLPLVHDVFETGKPEVSGIVAGPGDTKRLYLLVPLRDWQGRVARVAAGVVDPESERFAALLRPFRLTGRGSTDLLDRAGTVLATTDRGGRERPGGRDGDVLAYVPLAVVPWRVALRQPADDALATLTTRTIWMGGAVLVVGLGFAWGAAWSIRRPLRVLTRAAERIASGDMEEPIPSLGDDEVGRLGRSLDRMRIALRTSLAEIGRANQTLERRVDERTRELARVNQELSEREAARAQLLKKVIDAQEEERRRVARELHDETSQSLAALVMSLETVDPALPPGPAHDRVREAKAIAGRALDELHRILFDLRPSVLDDLGLISAIRWCAARHLEPLGIAVRCESTGLERRLPPEVETALFRVVQEAITNIAKHAGAESVLIQCTARDAAVTVEIEDDGRGFDADAPAPSRNGTGLGLAGMRERVTLLGGTLEIESARGDGTRIVVDVPLTRTVPRG